MPQHVIQRGNNRSVIFLAPADYRFFRDCLRAACDLHGCFVHAYVFMTNHAHLLMTPTTVSGIARVMQDVGRRYVRRFNDTHQRTGTLWEGRYKATLVETQQYLLACYRYIEMNPVRAGLVKDARDYRWSSYRANGLGARDPLITSHECYEALGDDAPARLRAYRALFAEALPVATVDVIRDSTNHGWALGSKQFRDDIAATLSRRTQPAPQGRPVRWKDENRL